MTDREVMQQALEALIDAANVLSAPMFADAVDALKAALEQQAEPVSMRMPKVGDKVICLEDESLGTVESLTAGGLPDITFEDGTRGTYLLREFAELFSYVAAPLDKTNFNAWWDGDYDDAANPYEPDSAAYWAWAGWQAAQRQWQGLTIDEVMSVLDHCEDSRIAVARDIEAKLKERNA